MDDNSANEGSVDLSAFAKADDNVIQPFSLEGSDLRGRAVRIGSVINDVLEPHGYPNPIAHLVAETMTVTALLSSMLKYDGIFTFQAHGDGPVSTLVADMMTGGDIRACATFDEERLQHSREQLSALKAEETSQNHLAQYLGKGYIAFTVDQGDKAERYQGIVELKGSSLVDCVQHYFNQSEQIGAGVKMAAGKRNGEWRAGAIMLQHLPEDQRNAESGAGNVREDDWRRAMILLDTCTEDELLDVDLHSNILLNRLFHEEGVRVYDSIPLVKGCRCDSEKVENIIYSLPEDDLDHIAEDGEVKMRCEFCSYDFVFDLEEIRSTIRERTAESSAKD